MGLPHPPGNLKVFKKGEAKKVNWVLARGVVRYDRSASSYPICLSLPATQVCHIWSARCNASQQDGFTRCFFGQVQSTELELVAEATVQRGCVVASFCSRSSSIDGERHMRRWLISAYQDGFTRGFFGQVQSTQLEFVAEAPVQRGCVVASFCSRSSSIDGERH